MSSLETLVKQSAELALKLWECDGELTPDLEAELDLVKEKLPAKIDNYGYLIDRLEQESEFLTHKMNDLLALQKRIDGLTQKLKDRMTTALHDTEKKELYGNEYKFKLSPTSGRTSIVDESQIPEKYKKRQLVETIDKQMIKSDLQKGEQVPGAQIEQTWSFRKTVGSKLLKG